MSNEPRKPVVAVLNPLALGQASLAAAISQQAMNTVTPEHRLRDALSRMRHAPDLLAAAQCALEAQSILSQMVQDSGFVITTETVPVPPLAQGRYSLRYSLRLSHSVRRALEEMNNPPKVG